MKQEIRFCTAADGVKLAYALSGEGPPLVMSASWLTHLEHQWRSLAWRPWLEALSRERTLVRYDSRGCGLSDREVGDVSFDTWVSDFECVVDAAGFDRFSLLGTCQGGPIAAEYAARHPGRVSKLVLYGTYARGRLRRVDLPNQIEKAKVLLSLTELGWGRENHAFLQVWATQFQPGGTLAHLRSWSEQQRAATTPQMAIRLMRASWNADVTQSASRIQCPVLVLHADRDAVVPIEEARRLAGRIPNCRFVQLEGENHMPLADEPGSGREAARTSGSTPAPRPSRPAASGSGWGRCPPVCWKPTCARGAWIREKRGCGPRSRGGAWGRRCSSTMPTRPSSTAISTTPSRIACCGRYACARKYPRSR